MFLVALVLSALVAIVSGDDLSGCWIETGSLGVFVITKTTSSKNFSVDNKIYGPTDWRSFGPTGAFGARTHAATF